MEMMRLRTSEPLDSSRGTVFAVQTCMTKTVSFTFGNQGVLGSSFINNITKIAAKNLNMKFTNFSEKASPTVVSKANQRVI